MMHLIKSSKNFLLKPSYQYRSYIHLRDHHKKVNPIKNKVTMSYMRTDVQQPKQPQYIDRLSLFVRNKLERKMFGEYKKNIIKGELYNEGQDEGDPLWGTEPVPVHFYKNLNGQQVTWLSYSDSMDVKNFKQQIIGSFFESKATIKRFEDVQDVNDLAKLALHYRFSGEEKRQKWHQLEQKIGNSFHKLTNQSLISLKFAFNDYPLYGSPKFNKILNDLLLEQLPNLSRQELIQVFYGNRKIKHSMQNIHLKVLEQIEKKYEEMSFSQKINWLFIYSESRFPLLSVDTLKKYRNQDRNKANQVLWKLEFDELNFKDINECKKFTYALAKTKVIQTKVFSYQILEYCLKEADNLTSEDCTFFLYYLPKLEGGAGVFNTELYNKFKQNLIEQWDNIDKIHKVRGLYSLWDFGMYDEKLHQLYSSIEFDTDSMIMGYICELQLANSSGRQWQLMYALVNVDYIPLQFVRSYKKFYNFIKEGNDYNLKPLQEKIQNTEPYFDIWRHKEKTIDKVLIRQFYKFYKFASVELPIEINVPINNAEIVNFAFPEKKISIDIASELQLIPGTRELKESAKVKTKNLSSFGWLHIYIYEQDFAEVPLQQFFSRLQKEIDPYLPQHEQALKAFNEYELYQYSKARSEQLIRTLKGDQYELYQNHDAKKASDILTSRYKRNQKRKQRK